MSSTRRSTRAKKKETPSSTKEALQQLKEIKQGKKKQSDLYIEEQVEKIYDEVSEDEYNEIVCSRNAKGNFVVSDDEDEANGYEDDGEEHWDEDKPKKTQRKKRVKHGALFAESLENDRLRKKVDKTNSQSISKMMMKIQTQKKAPMKATVTAKTENPVDENLVESKLQDLLNADPLSFIPSRSKKKKKAKRKSKKKADRIAKPSFASLLADNTVVEQETTIVTNDGDDNLAAMMMDDDPIQSSTSIKKEQSSSSAQNVKNENASITYNEYAREDETPKPLHAADGDWMQALGDSSNSKDESKMEEDDEKMNTDEEEDATSLPESNDSKLSFYLIDACEERNCKGSIFLFGKVKKPSAKPNESIYESCCIRVKNIAKRLFVAPRKYKLDSRGNETREPVEIQDVVQEFNEIRQQYKINKVLMKPTDRNYCFDQEGVPHGSSTFLKVKYNASYPDLPADVSGKTISHVFGVQSSALEQFILKQHIMGPSWLTVSAPTKPKLNISWCKQEFEVEDMKLITPMDKQPPSPPLSVMSLKTTSILNSSKNEIVMVTMMVHPGINTEGATPNWAKQVKRISAIRKIQGRPFPTNIESHASRTIKVCSSERNLLNYVLSRILYFDIDILVGHNFVGYDLDVLLHRMKAQSVSSWDQLGRIRRSVMPKLQAGSGGQRDSTWEEKHIVSGRLMCDSYLAAKEFVKHSSYSLPALVETKFNASILKVDYEKVDMLIQKADGIKVLIEHGEQYAYWALHLIFAIKALPLTKTLTQISGNLWINTLMGKRAQRIEYVLLHQFHNRKYILPDKLRVDYSNKDGKEKSRRKKAKYSGGLVLEPISGFYDKLILLLDFNSLYPSLIKEHNVCFTTIVRRRKEKEAQEQEEQDQTAIPSSSSTSTSTSSSSSEDEWLPCSPPPKSTPEGILPKIIWELVQRRKGVKQLMANAKNDIKREQFNIKQLALKLTANSIYGCLGFAMSRFKAVPLAELITRKGREALSQTVQLADEEGLTVVYGDTDSIMVHTNSRSIAKAKLIARIIKEKVNKTYSTLEIELDGIFKSMLLLKKKKYAALMVNDIHLKNIKSLPKDALLNSELLLAEEEQANKIWGSITTNKEIKGLDLVRRDWCPLSKRMGTHVLDVILSGKPSDDVVRDIHNYLQTMTTQLQKMKVQEFVITKALSKEPEDYANPKSLPHVQVALKLRAAGQGVRVGNHIEYVICEGDASSYAERAFHPDHVRKAGAALPIDYKWYLTQQIHPPISRLCDVISGTDSRRIAECLGLDPAKFSSSSLGADSEEKYFASTCRMDEKERYKNAEELVVTCQQCRKTSLFPGVLRLSTSSLSEVKTAKDVETGAVCPECKLQYSAVAIENSLVRFIRRVVSKHYEHWLKCDEPMCQLRSKTIKYKNRAKCLADGCKGTMHEEYSAKELYTQLMYLKHLFDVDGYIDKQKDKENNITNGTSTTNNSTIKNIISAVANKHRNVYDDWLAVVDDYLSLNKHNFVDLDNLFSFY